MAAISKISRYSVHYLTLNKNKLYGLLRFDHDYDTFRVFSPPLGALGLMNGLFHPILA